ncbi:MAG: hypothetical protein P8J78_12230 [Maricaulis sp.]|nr:hypothetical protein [Maricaulis sp.]MDG2045368.1 hypothetical protein [Maricaulis sp.]
MSGFVSRRVRGVVTMAALVAAGAVASVPAIAVQPVYGAEAYIGTVRLDCYGDGTIQHTGTSNTITITVVSAVGRETMTVVPTDSACEPDVVGSILTGGVTDYYGISKQFTSYTSYPVQYVRISTNGDNGFWMDQVSLSAGGASDNWGVNGERGYCLSTDPSDADRSWRNYVGSRGCQRCMQFNVDGGVTSC